MDYIRKYDIELEKEQYYAGEILRGWVVVENAENLRITGQLYTLRCIARGRLKTRSCIGYRQPALDPHGSRTGSQISI